MHSTPKGDPASVLLPLLLLLFILQTSQSFKAIHFVNSNNRRGTQTYTADHNMPSSSSEVATTKSTPPGPAVQAAAVEAAVVEAPVVEAPVPVPVPSTADTLKFLSLICGKLKKIKRTGWIRHKIPFPESDADHMHRCAMCALLVTTQPPHPLDMEKGDDYDFFHPGKIDSNKLLKMAITHDLCESIAGDITPFCSKQEINSKYDREQNAMQEIRKIVGDPLGLELYNLWKEYEEQKTVEALYCKDIDKFEMVLQAFEYEEEHLMVVVNNKNKNNKSSSSNSNNNKNMNERRCGGVGWEDSNESVTKKQKMDSSNKEKQDEDALDKNSAAAAAADNENNNNKDGTRIITEPLRTFYITTNDKMKSPLFRRLDAELREKREKLLNDRGWQVTDEERQQYEV